QPLQEIAQQLVAAGAEVLVPRLPEQRRQLGLGHREARIGEHLVHVEILQLEGHPQLLQHNVVADALLHRPRRHALVPAAQVHDQPVQEMRQHGVAANQVAGFVLLQQEGAHIILLEDEGRIGQLGDLDHPVVAQVEHVADAAQDVVVDHGVARRPYRPPILPVPPAWLPPDRALDDDAFRQPLIIAHPPRLYPHQVAAFQVLRAIAAALVFDRGPAVVGHLHGVAVSAAVEADQARPRVDMGDRAAQLVAVAIAVIVSVAAPVAALADIAYNLDRTRQQFAPRLRDIDLDHVTTLQALDRTLAALVEQSRALVITQLHPLHTAAARIVDHQEDSLVAGI